MQTNKFKTATVSIMTAIASMLPHAAKADNDIITTNKENTTNAAARITTGNVVKYETKKSGTHDLSFTEYYIDENGDGRADVIRRSISRDGDTYIPQMAYSPFSIVEFIEIYDEKHHMWNISQTNVVGSRKLKTAPTYVRQQKTR